MEDFGKLENTPVEGATEGVANNAKKEKLAKMRALLKETVNEDSTYLARRCSLSDSVQVLNTLGFGDSGNIVVDEETKNLPKDKRRLVSTSQIVGYRVQNIGTEAISYLTEEFKQNEEGVWVGTRVEKTMSPGDTVDFTRKYMTIFCSTPEISFKLANGKIIRGAASTKSGDVDGELEAHYFSFADKTLKVNSDNVKLNVAKKVKGADGADKWVVKKDFEAVFGYLNNAKTAGKRGRQTAAGPKISVQDMAANYIQKLLKETGSI